MNMAKPLARRERPTPVIEVQGDLTHKVEHVTIDYKITFSFSFDVEHLLTQDEYVELVKRAVYDFRDQLPAHVQAYPELILKELVKRNLINMQAFAERAPTNRG